MTAPATPHPPQTPGPSALPPHAGEPLALLTLHGKAQAVAGPLAAAGYAVFTVTGMDTDALGTFTGETPRTLTPLEAARTKAEHAARLGGCRWGLGSEGSFGPDPYLGLSGWGRELLVAWDAQAGRSVHAACEGAETNYAQTTVADLDAALAFAARAGHPGHGVIVGRPGEPWFCKDTPDDPSAWAALLRQALAQAVPAAGGLWLETDMRAHRNPTRMAMIGRCAQALASALQTACPACGAAGFVATRSLSGARCTGCNRPTRAVRAQVRQCSACGHADEVEVQATVPPSRCDFCNP